MNVTEASQRVNLTTGVATPGRRSDDMVVGQDEPVGTQDDA